MKDNKSLPYKSAQNTNSSKTNPSSNSITSGLKPMEPKKPISKPIDAKSSSNTNTSKFDQRKR